MSDADVVVSDVFDILAPALRLGKSGLLYCVDDACDPLRHPVIPRVYDHFVIVHHAGVRKALHAVPRVHEERIKRFYVSPALRRVRLAVRALLLELKFDLELCPPDVSLDVEESDGPLPFRDGDRSAQRRAAARPRRG